LFEAFQLINNLSVSMLRGSFAPAGTPEAAVKALHAVWEGLAQDKDFAADYTKVIKAPPNLIQADEAQAHVKAAQQVSPKIVAFIKDSVGRK
jgi:tripartite-type tricarboxylate transporter receptor subunit TctC